MLTEAEWLSYAMRTKILVKLLGEIALKDESQIFYRNLGIRQV